MIQLLIKNRSIWVGKHQAIGIVIYDSKDQSGIELDTVRLHRLDQDLPCIFHKSVVRKKMVRLEEYELKEHLPSIHKYINSKGDSSGCIQCGGPTFPQDHLYEYFDNGLCDSCDHEQYLAEQEAMQDERQRRNDEIEIELQKENFYGRYGHPWSF